MIEISKHLCVIVLRVFEDLDTVLQDNIETLNELNDLLDELGFHSLRVETCIFGNRVQSTSQIIGFSHGTFTYQL
jgi:hypothetical protein